MSTGATGPVMGSGAAAATSRLLDRLAPDVLAARGLLHLGGEVGQLGDLAASMVSPFSAGQRVAQATASSFDLTWMIQ